MLLFVVVDFDLWCFVVIILFLLVLGICRFDCFWVLGIESWWFDGKLELLCGSDEDDEDLICLVLLRFGFVNKWNV